MARIVKPTLRLISRHWNNLSFELNMIVPNASMSLRRRTSKRMLHVPRGGVVDLCKMIGVETPAEARTIIERTGQMQKYLPPTGNMLVLVDWPPPPAPVVVAPPPPPPAPEPDPEPDATVDPLLPNLEWSREELREYAIDKGVMAGKRWTKVQMLTAIEELRGD